MEHGNGDGNARGRFIFTDAEREQFADAVRAGILETLDGRADGRADVDALGDAARVGERLADGFALLGFTE
jgi:arginine/ornithine N-succinyltransferase beta subunit